MKTKRAGNTFKSSFWGGGQRFSRTARWGLTAFAILVGIFQQAAAQIVPNNSYANMLNIISNQNQSFWNQQNRYNAWLSNQGTRTVADTGPVTQEQSLAAVLAGHRWQIQSGGLACHGLMAVFLVDGTFQGILQNPPNDFVIRPQRVRGRWHVAGGLLMLSYNYVMNLSGPARAEFMIQITNGSARSLTGIDQPQYLTVYSRPRLWEFERLD
jgi:hypothetical protein